MTIWLSAGETFVCVFFSLSFKPVCGNGYIALESIPSDRYRGARRWSNYSRWEPDGWEWGRGYSLWVYSNCKSLKQFSHIYPRWPLKCLVGSSWRFAVTESVKGPWRFTSQLSQQRVIAAKRERLEQLFKLRSSFNFCTVVLRAETSSSYMLFCTSSVVSVSYCQLSLTVSVWETKYSINAQEQAMSFSISIPDSAAWDTPETWIQEHSEQPFSKK